MVKGSKMTKEQRERVRIGVQLAYSEGKCQKPEHHGASVSAGRKGMKFTEAHRRAIAAGGIGNKNAKANKSHGFSGKSHRVETKLRISAAKTGVRLSELHKKKLSFATARYSALWPKPPTSIELILYAYLRLKGIEYVSQKRFGNRVVDAYLPSRHVAVEADGAYWHNRPGAQERDVKRDEYLRAKFGLTVVRVGESRLRRVNKMLSLVA